MTYQPRSYSPDTPPSSSGAATPTTSASLSSSITNMWTGLMRRFSSEADSDLTYSSSADGYPTGLHGPSPTSHFKDDGINGVFMPTMRTASPFRPPPLDPIALHGYKTGTPQSARLLTPAVAEEIRIMVPERLRIAEDWKLVYSLDQDGSSLSTLYQKCKAYERKRVGFVLVVRDGDGGTFGAYLSDYPHPAPKYYGNGECFLWRASVLAGLPPPPSSDTTNLSGRSTTIASPTRSSFPTLSPPNSNDDSLKLSSSSPGVGSGIGSQQVLLAPHPESIRFKAFPYSGINDYYINSETGYLSVGAGDGGHYGLWIDDSLEVGHSGRCDTFGNEPLSDEGEKFNVMGVEIWVLGD